MTNRRALPSIVPLLTAAALMLSHAAAAAQTADHVRAGPNVVEITAEDYAFRAPAEIPSGWTTFRFENGGEEHHLLLLVRLPEGKTFDDYVADVTLPFDAVWQPLRGGEIDQAQAMERLGAEVAPWFWDAQYMGGVGLLAPGAAAESTVHLEPGNYVIECYMKTPEGEFHAMEGMADPLIVTEDRSADAEPAADLRVTLSEQGMDIDGDLQPGTHTFEVRYADHPEGTFGHDVQVARLGEGTSHDEVMYWLNWLNVDGLTEPAPATFLGGINQMPVGSTGYFTVNLAPGRYLLVSEYTGPMGVLHEFTIAP